MHDWAKREVEIAKKQENGFTYGEMCYDSALKAYLSLCEDGHSGIGYPCLSNEFLQKIIQDSIQEPTKIHAMKKKCLAKANDYIPENAIGILLEKL